MILTNHIYIQFLLRYFFTILYIRLASLSQAYMDANYVLTEIISLLSLHYLSKTKIIYKEDINFKTFGTDNVPASAWVILCAQLFLYSKHLPLPETQSLVTHCTQRFNAKNAKMFYSRKDPPKNINWEWISLLI